MHRLDEGMRAGDLKDLVLPLLSVDEYESKVDDEAVVIGFYVHDSDAAKDLNRFMQKSAVPLLDTEVAPAPDSHGYYLVFVEMLVNDRLGANMAALLEEVGPLADVDGWQMRARKSDGLLPFDAQALMDAVHRARTHDVQESALQEFLGQSALHSLLITPGNLLIEGCDAKAAFEVVAFGMEDAALKSAGLCNAAVDLRVGAVTACRRINRMLGEGWDTQRVRGHLLLRRDGSDFCLVLVDR